MLQPILLDGCTKLTSTRKVTKVYSNNECISIERAAMKSGLPSVYISEWDKEISVRYSMEHKYPLKLSAAACMTIKSYFQEICTIYDNLGIVEGTGSGYSALPTIGYLNRVLPEDAYDIGQSIYDIVMDPRNWCK